MTFRIGEERTIAGVIKTLDFLNPSKDADHVEHKKRFAERGAWARVEITSAAKDSNLSILLEEGFTKSNGHNTSKSVCVYLHPILARQLRDWLVNAYPDIEE